MKHWKKYLFLIHRYLGLFLAPLILLWCVSGAVMMYVGYPKLSEQERISHLAPFPNSVPPNSGSDALFTQLKYLLKYEVGSLVIENFDGQLNARLDGRLVKGNEDDQLVLSAGVLHRIAAYYSDEKLSLENPLEIEELARDQWTVYSKYNKHRPLHRIELEDEAGTEIYVSSTTGEVVQKTTTHERGWSWLGAVLHWLYPTIIRQYGTLWYWGVIVLTLFSLAATFTGVWLGLKQLKKRKNKPLSPYKGMKKLHHWGGVVLSLFLTLFLLSGLLSMNPWGLLNSEKVDEDGLLQRFVDRETVIESLEHLPDFLAQNQVLLLETLPVNAQLFWLVHVRDSKGNVSVFRVNEKFESAPVKHSDLLLWGQQLTLDGALSESVIQGYMETQDHYYFSHKDEIELPVWKVEDSRSDGRLFYLSPTTGAVLKQLDANGRIYRWLFHALHRWDFAESVRQRPIWDLLLMPMMVLLVLFGMTACYLGYKRMR